MHSIVHVDIDEELIKKAAITTKRGGDPSGLDADRYRRVIVSSCFGPATSDLCKTIVELVKKLCITDISNNNNCASFESLVACRLIPLNKYPGLRPIGVGEVLRRISGKVVKQHAHYKFVLDRKLLLKQQETQFTTYSKIML